MQGGGGVAPDLVIVHGSVQTMDLRLARAEAVAVLGNRIVAVGSDDHILGLAAPSTRVIEAQGGSVLPGFNDAHVHFIAGGFSLSNVNLRGARSVQEMVTRLGDYASTAPRGQWIQGGDWDHEDWPGAPLPARGDVDRATPANPVFLRRLDGHMALANSLALKLAVITTETADPPGGTIVRDARGAPTGVLKDAAMDLVLRVMPARGRAEKMMAVRAATNYAASLGVTSVTDVSADDDLPLYQELAARGELKTRIYGARPITSWEALRNAGIQAGFGNDLVRTGCVKGFADGSLGSSTALFFETYADDATNRGLLFDQMLPEGVMLERATGSDAAGIQVLIHAIGDAANFRILEIFREIAAQNGPRDRRSRIEHAQHLRASEVGRFAAQGVIASMQPYHAVDDGRWCEKRIGAQRAKGAYLCKSLLRSGATLAFGSDWTVAPLDPLPGIKAAVTRQTLDGRHARGWNPEEKISLGEAIHGYTMGSAYAEFSEGTKGSITPGKLADIVVLDRDLQAIAPEEIDQAQVVLTLLGGSVVFEKL